MKIDLVPCGGVLQLSESQTDFNFGELVFSNSYFSIKNA